MAETSQIITLIINYMKQALTGIIGALVEGAEALVYNTTGETQQLTVLFAVVLTFTALSIGFAIVKWLFSLVKIY